MQIQAVGRDDRIGQPVPAPAALTAPSLFHIHSKLKTNYLYEVIQQLAAIKQSEHKLERQHGGHALILQGNDMYNRVNFPSQA